MSAAAEIIAGANQALAKSLAPTELRAKNNNIGPASKRRRIDDDDDDDDDDGGGDDVAATMAGAASARKDKDNNNNSSTTTAHPLELEIESCSSLLQLEHHVTRLERDMLKYVSAKSAEIDRAKRRIEYVKMMKSQLEAAAAAAAAVSNGINNNTNNNHKPAVEVWRKDQWPPILQPVFHKFHTGAYLWGRQPRTHPCFATSHSGVVGPSAQILQRAIEMNSRYQLQNKGGHSSSSSSSSSSGSDNFDTINLSTINKVSGGGGGTKNAQGGFNNNVSFANVNHDHNGNFIILLAVVIATNTTKPPAIVHKDREAQNELILSSVRNNIAVLHDRLRLPCREHVDAMMGYELDSYYRRFKRIRSKAYSGVISDWRDRRLTTVGKFYMFVHHYGVLAPFVHFTEEKVRMLGSRTAGMFDEETKLFVPCGGGNGGGGGVKEGGPEWKEKVENEEDAESDEGDSTSDEGEAKLPILV